MSVAAAPEVTGLILAAGGGERLNGEPKAFLSWRGEPLLAHAIRNMSALCSRILVGVRSEDTDRAAALLQSARSRYGAAAALVSGGATRRATLLNLLLEDTAEWVVLHDVARPFTNPRLFEQVLAAALEHGAASAAAPLRVRDGIAEHADGFLERVVPQSRLMAVHTPQACRAAWLREALLDDTPQLANEPNVAALLRAHGRRVCVVWDEADNVKITYPEDLRLLG